MTNQVLDAHNVNDLDELMTALTSFVSTAKSLGHHSTTVYPDHGRVTLVEETLTDGSTVLNVHFFVGEHGLTG